MKRKRESAETESTARTKPSKHNAEDAVPQTADTGSNINTAISKMDSRILADYIAQRTKRFGEDLSLVELEDMHIPESAILDTSAWAPDRLAANLPDFLEYCAQQNRKSTALAEAPKKSGSPHTLVLTGAALRAADLSRVLRKFQSKQATVAKLFAKHIKLKDAAEFVKKTRINIGVGTPTRIIGLVAEGALRLEHIERLIIDTSFLDRKNRSIFDMKETQQPLMQLLNMDELKSRYTTIGSPVTLAFY
ncbi:MAG: hypothetical protein Q9168_000371 [Polycauliona sp. 1 TL-2023]